MTPRFGTRVRKLGELGELSNAGSPPESNNATLHFETTRRSHSRAAVHHSTSNLMHSESKPLAKWPLDGFDRDTNCETQWARRGACIRPMWGNSLHLH